MLLFQRATLALSLVLTSASAIGAPDITDKDKQLRGRGTSGTLREANDAMVADNGDHPFGLAAEGSERRLASVNTTAVNTTAVNTTAVNTTEISCPDGFKRFVLSLQTDGNPQDTFWTLNSTDVDFEGGNYTDIYTEYSQSECLPAGNYDFTIWDLWGDGICCNYGNGTYILSLDGEEIWEGGDFGYFEDFNFSTEPEPESLSPSVTPSISATSSSSATPSIFATTSSKPSSESSNMSTNKTIKFVVCAEKEPKHKDIICKDGQAISDDVDFCKECEKMEEHAKQCYAAECVDGQAADK